jgi:peptidoglycan/LPS O-acetylase OafA/YrhL
MIEDMGDITDPRTPVRARGVPRLPVLKALTTVRFFAAFHVALFHLVRPFSLWGPIAPVISAGYAGVSFFFILSGFILTYSHATEWELGKGSAKRFWIARFARIYPVYFLSMLFAGYAGLNYFRQPIHILAYIADLLMVQSWSIRMVNFFHVTAWTLSVEMFFYLVFPFLFLRLLPRTRAKGYLAVFGFWLLAMLPPLLCVIFDPEGSWTEGGRQTAWVFRVHRLPIVALPEFLAGVSLGWIFLRFPPAPRIAQYFAPVGTVAYITILFLSPHLPNVMISNGIFIPLYALIILGLSENNWFSRALSASWLVLLGEASFALYLFHFMFNDWTMQRFGASEGVASATWKLAILIPVSIGLHIYVERPARRAILRWWNRRQTARQTA